MWNLNAIVEILFVALGCASLALWIFDIIQEDMILERYGLLIKDKYIGKPLGWCPTCSCVWISVIASLLLGFGNLDTIMTIGISNAFLRLITK